MTPDDVVEAMARGMYESAGIRDPWDKASRRAKAVWFIYARAAIRALPAGWVVAKVPERYPAGSNYADGHNAAIAAFRASAVEVG